MKSPFFIRNLLMTLLFVPMLSGCLRSISRFDDRGWDGLLIGIQSYREGRYREAIPVLLDVIESYPGAPLLEEAQWFLAKSYLGEGDKGSAARELQFFLQNYPNSSHEESAHSVLFRLDPFHKKTMAGYLNPRRQRPLQAEIDFLKDRGINTVIIPVAYEIATGGFTVKESAQGEKDPLGEWIQAAHLAGLRVIVRLPLRDLRGVTERRPEWRDLRYDGEARRLLPIDKLDIFNKNVRKAILRTYRRLSQYPVDGITVGEISYGMDEGWTGAALDLYQDLFLERPAPFRVIGNPVRFIGQEEPYPPSSQFWHWVGWRSRYINSLLKDIQKEVKSIRSEIQFGIAIPVVLLLDPVRGLAENSLDLLELNQSRFDFYVLISESRRPGPPILLDALSRYAIQPERIWFQSALHNGPEFLSLKSSLQGLVFP